MLDYVKEYREHFSLFLQAVQARKKLIIKMKSASR